MLIQSVSSYSADSAATARTRSSAWSNLLPALGGDAEAIRCSKESISSIAKKAEVKARTAAGTATQTLQTSTIVPSTDPHQQQQHLSQAVPPTMFAASEAIIDADVL